MYQVPLVDTCSNQVIGHNIVYSLAEFLKQSTIQTPLEGHQA